MKKKEEDKELLLNKRLITSMLIFVITIALFYVGICLLACLSLEGYVLGLVISIATIIMVVVAFYALKIEVDTGYYECRNCHNRFVPKSYFIAMISPHIHTTRYLRCPKCNKTSWSKKVMTK